MQRPPQRWLKARALLAHPGVRGLTSLNSEPGEALIALAAGDAQEIRQILLFAISVFQNIGRRAVHQTHVAGVPAVTAAIVARCALEDCDRRAVLPRCQCSAKG